MVVQSSFNGSTFLTHLHKLVIIRTGFVQMSHILSVGIFSVKDIIEFLPCTKVWVQSSYWLSPTDLEQHVHVYCAMFGGSVHFLDLSTYDANMGTDFTCNGVFKHI